MDHNKDCAMREIISIVKEKGIEDKKSLLRIKRQVGRKYGLKKIINDSELFKISRMKVFSRKPSRSISGVSVVAVMTSPAPCPHGKCVFCPGGVDANTPQSYTGEEPAALRARMNNYDPCKQVKSRIEQYNMTGHPSDKIELIIMGGTFTHRSWDYQKWFVKRCFDAMNSGNSKSLEDSQTMNEKAKHRCVGLTIETRPDEINPQTIRRMLTLGATRVELGVQSTYERVLEKSHRGHTAKDSVVATKLLKNAGFKINYHMMLNMPGSSIEKDFLSFKKIFEDSRFRPDMIKIYPTLLIKGTKLYDMYKKGKWKPYAKEEIIRLIARIKSIVPRYVRIMRIQRDIPSFKIEQDLKNSNLRELVRNYMSKKGMRCMCIRCREAGRNKSNIETAEFKTIKYRASEGDEYFIECADSNDFIFGFIRLRIPDRSNVGFVRELHVYGREIQIGKEGDIQHRGIGKKLLKMAEEICARRGVERIDVISGVGVREYYRKLGYKKRGFYMSKFI